jgi:arylsulfatase A-like enzyme
MKAVVVIIRGCPAGWLGAYGNEWVVTPNLDRLAAESVVFDRHISDRPEPAAAGRAWLGGEGGWPGAFRERGIPAVLVRANHPDTDAPGWYYEPWGEVFDARPQQEDDSPLDALLRSLPALLDRLEGASEWLVCVEIDRLLPPWDVPEAVFRAYLEHEADAEVPKDDVEDQLDSGLPEGDGAEGGEAEPTDEPVVPWRDPPAGPFDAGDAAAREWLATSFGALVTGLDAELGQLFDLLRERELDQSAGWIVTSDFGYPLGEHGQVGLHRPWLHEELVHLPLILRLPGSEQAGRRVFGFTQPPDLAPTVLDLFGLGAGTGPSLLALARGEVSSIRESAVTALELGDAAERSIRTDEWAFLLPVRVPEGESRAPQLFQKPDDHWEVNDLRARNMERADELEVALRTT